MSGRPRPRCTDDRSRHHGCAWATYGSIAAAVALVGFGAWSLLSSRTRTHGDGVRHGTRSDRVDRRRAAETSPGDSDRRAGGDAAGSRASTSCSFSTATTRPRKRPSASSSPCGTSSTARTAARVATRLGSQGLECLFQKGSWAQLRTLNRPAVLTLTDDVGRTHQVVLTGLTDESATIQLGGAARDGADHALSRYWFGDFLLLWKPPMALGEVARPRHARRRRALASRQHARRAGPAAGAGAQRRLRRRPDPSGAGIPATAPAQRRRRRGCSDPDRARYGAECDGLADAGRYHAQRAEG